MMKNDPSDIIGKRVYPDRVIVEAERIGNHIRTRIEEVASSATVASPEHCDMLATPPVITEVTIRRSGNEFSLQSPEIVIAYGCSKEATMEIIESLLDTISQNSKVG